VRDHDHLLYHFGGKSVRGKSKIATRNAKGMNVKRSDVIGWFAGHSVDVVERA
jgi:hypothetical protein